MEEQNLSSVLWRRKLLIVFCLLVGVGFAIAVTVLQEKEYESTAILQVSSPNLAPSDSTNLANQGLATNYAEVLVSPSFLERISSTVADGEFSADELEGKLDAEWVSETALIKLSARGASPEEAQELASDVSNEFLATLRRDAAQRVREQQAEIDRLIADLESRIAEAELAAEPTAQLEATSAALARQRALLAANGIAQGASTSLAAPPSASSEPVRPRPLLNLAAGLALGLLLGVGLAWLRERIRPLLHTSEEAAAAADLPLLASVPLRRRLLANDPMLSEAYDVLRANLTLHARTTALHSVVFVSQNPAVGKTSAVAGVARAAARGGSRVVVVDADLRAGSLTRRSGHDTSRGLPDAVLNEAPLDDVLIELDPNLWGLMAGTGVANPPSLLHSPRMKQVLSELGDRFDLVLIDSPPIAHLADGLVLASLSDAAVVIARSKVTSQRDLQKAVASLRPTGTYVAGLVMFEPVDVDDSYYAAGLESRTVVLDAAESR